jgi:hypothetical protein
MKTLTMIAAILALSSLLPGVAFADEPTGHYCNMGVFTASALKRHQELVPALVGKVSSWRELPNGYVFQFSGTFENAGEWLDGVRRCCPTLNYQVDFAPQGGNAQLRITGTNGAKEFIREEFDRIFVKKG